MKGDSAHHMSLNFMLIAGHIIIDYLIIIECKFRLVLLKLLGDLTLLNSVVLKEKHYFHVMNTSKDMSRATFHHY